MYYAKHNGVGIADQLPPGAIAITPEQYAEAIERMQGGERVVVTDGALSFIVPETPSTAYAIDAEGFYTHTVEALPDAAGVVFVAPDPDMLRPKWDGAAWIEGATPETVLATHKSQKLAEVNAAYEVALSAVKDGYPPSEILSWDKQEKEARAYLADNAAPTPFIDALSAERGIAKPELVDRIMAKVSLAEIHIGTATGKRQRLEDQITAATTEAELALIVW